MRFAEMGLSGPRGLLKGLAIHSVVSGNSFGRVFIRTNELPRQFIWWEIPQEIRVMSAGSVGVGRGAWGWEREGKG